MRKRLRWFLVAIFTVLVLPVLQEFAIDFARRQGLYDNPTGTASAAWRYVQMIADIPYFQYVLVFVGGLMLGTWIDTALARRPTPKQELVRIGRACLSLSLNAKRVAENPWLYGNEYFELLTNYSVIAIKLHKHNIPSIEPNTSVGIEQSAGAIYRYLSYIGKLLSSGEVELARDHAQSIVDQPKAAVASESA